MANYEILQVITSTCESVSCNNKSTVAIPEGVDAKDETAMSEAIESALMKKGWGNLGVTIMDGDKLVETSKLVCKRCIASTMRRLKSKEELAAERSDLENADLEVQNLRFKLKRLDTKIEKIKESGKKVTKKIKDERAETSQAFEAAKVAAKDLKAKEKADKEKSK